MRVCIDGQDKTAEIRDPKITEQVKYIASAGPLRESWCRCSGTLRPDASGL